MVVGKFSSGLVVVADWVRCETDWVRCFVCMYMCEIMLQRGWAYMHSSCFISS